LHPQHNRRFTVREIARIQTFPDSFNFDFSRIDSAYKMVGNAIPPALAWLLTAEILFGMNIAVKNISCLKKTEFSLEP